MILAVGVLVLRVHTEPLSSNRPHVSERTSPVNFPESHLDGAGVVAVQALFATVAYEETTDEPRRARS